MAAISYQRSWCHIRHQRVEHENACGGQNAIGAANIELAQIYAGSLCVLLQQEGRNQIAGNNEKDPYSSQGVGAEELWHRPCMGQMPDADHGDGDCAETVERWNAFH